MYKANYKRLYKIASRLLYDRLGNTSDVQDILQEVFLLAKEKEINKHPSPEGWLMIATRNLCGNYIQAAYRSSAKQQRYERENLVQNLNNMQMFSGHHADETKISDMMITLEQSLKPEDWKCLRLYCIEDKPAEKIAQELGISESAVRVKICRLRMRVKKFYEEV